MSRLIKPALIIGDIDKRLARKLVWLRKTMARGDAGAIGGPPGAFMTAMLGPGGTIYMVTKFVTDGHRGGTDVRTGTRI